MKTQFKIFASIALVALVCVGALVVAQTAGGNGEDKDKKVEKKIEIVEENGLKTMTVTTTTDGITTVETFEGAEVDEYLAKQGNAHANVWHSADGSSHNMMKFQFHSDSGDNNFEFNTIDISEMLEGMDFATHFEGIEGLDAAEIQAEIEKAMAEMENLDFNFNIDVSEDGENKTVIINSSSDDADGQMQTKVVVIGGGDGDVNHWMNEDGQVIVNVEEEIDGETKKTVVISKIIRIEDVEEGESPIESSNDLVINDLKFYPNPTQGQFTLEFDAPDKGRTDIRVTDMTGREVYNGTVKGAGHHTHQIDISEEGKGVYLLNLVQGKKSIVKKIVLD